MVIQRWQTVLLFVSLVLISIFSVSNYAALELPGGEMVDINASGNTAYWIYNIIIVLVLLLSIFLFKRLNIQKLWVVIASLMEIGDAIWGFCHLKQLPTLQGGTLHYNASWILLIVAFVLTISAYCLIRSDQKLLKSYDRIR